MKIKKYSNKFRKMLGGFRPIWKDPAQRYGFLFIIVFAGCLLLFSTLLRDGKKVKFVVSGRVTSVKDGDTFKIGDETIMLYGIDAPELNQKCDYYNVYTKKVAQYSCGKNAWRYLKKIIQSRQLRCEVRDENRDENRDGVLLAVCYVGKYDKKTKKYSDDFEVNRDVVRNGYAIAYTKHSKAYVQHEDFARKQKRGIWNGEFVEPEKFRETNK